MPDHEAEIRSRLMGLLSVDFNCFEEVSLVGLNGDKLSCDVLAIPRVTKFAHLVLAIECKRPNRDWHYAPWSDAIKQAADYVLSSPADARIQDDVVVAGAIIYPAPMTTPSAGILPGNELVRNGYENAIAGMFHLALKFRVGRAGERHRANISYFSITFGPNEVCNERTHFKENYLRLLENSRPVGSTRKRPIQTRL